MNKQLTTDKVLEHKRMSVYHLNYLIIFQTTYLQQGIASMI